MRPSRLLSTAASRLAYLGRSLRRRPSRDLREAALRDRMAGRRASDSALENIREEERAYIARELHDDLGQLLATLRVDLNLLLLQPQTSSAAIELLASMDQLVLSALTSLRRIAGNLRPRALDEGGLYFALQSLRHDFEKRHGIRCRLDADETELMLDDRHSTAIFRIVQESLTNISRHADASNVDLTLRRDTAGLHITIHDDGRGIRQADMDKQTSFGLLGMRERVWAVRGEIHIDGGEGGTRIYIVLPLLFNGAARGVG